MRLYIVQHGDAVAKDVDPDRPLSDQGRADIERLADLLGKHKIQVARIFHSGKTRAKETAELLRPLLERQGEFEEQQGLAPNDSPDAFLRQSVRADKDTLIVSHMPFVARIVSQALTGVPDRQLLEFAPGGVAGIERGDSASWRLFMFLRPEIL